MSTFLFDKIIFGPVNSRRLGVSLGINLLYQDSKLCNYDCAYCECGWSCDEHNKELPSSEVVIHELEFFFKNPASNSKNLDVITFAGNGEPTLHPEFLRIIDETIRLRDKYVPEVKIAVLTNATTLNNPGIIEGLNKIEMPILKIDTVDQFEYELINRPLNNMGIQKIVDSIILKINNPIIQTMFLKGWFNDHYFDNTSERSINEYLRTIKKISPSLVMIYSIARDTPMKGLERVELSCLEMIGKAINSMGIRTLITP